MTEKTQVPTASGYQARLSAYMVILGCDLDMDARTRNVISDLLEYVIQHEQARAAATLQVVITQAEECGRQQAMIKATKLLCAECRRDTPILLEELPDIIHDTGNDYVSCTARQIRASMEAEARHDQ